MGGNTQPEPAEGNLSRRRRRALSSCGVGRPRPPPPLSHMSTVETTTQAARHGAEEKKCTFPQEGGFLVMRGDRGGLGQKRHGVVSFWPFPTIHRFTRQSLPPTEGRSGCPECHWDLAGRLGDHLSLGLSGGVYFLAVLARPEGQAGTGQRER